MSLPGKIKEVPPDLQGIQPWKLQVWNYNMIWYDMNGNFNKMVCTYKFFTGDRVWRNQTGERELFWFTALIFTRADPQKMKFQRWE